MNKFVASVFKTIAFAMIFVFVFDMCFYLYRALSLNQRMESLMSSVRQVVMLNNGLTESDAELYQELLYQMAADFNGTTYNGNTNSLLGSDPFIVGMNWNFNTSVSSYLDNWADVKPNVKGTKWIYNTNNGVWEQKSNVDLVHTKLDDIGTYGDIQTIYISVTINQPMWTFSGNHSANDWNRTANYRTTTLKYLEFVPCLMYTSITQ